VLIGGVAVSALGGDGNDDTVTIEAAAGARGAPGHGIVFYSGEKEAGVAEADQYSDWSTSSTTGPSGSHTPTGPKVAALRMLQPRTPPTATSAS